MAGLACAHTLRSAGMTDICILEAQDYVGGRTKSITTHGVTTEIGAEFVHGEHAVTWDFIRKIGLTTQEWSAAYGAERLFADNGSIRPDNAEFLSTFNSLKSQLYSAAADAPSVGDWIDQADASDEVKFYLNRMIGDIESCDSHNLGLAEFLDASSKWTSGDRNFFVDQGYGEIVRYLSKGLDIQLQTPVTHIDYTAADYVAIKTATGAIYHASKIVLTVPLGVLKQNSIAFTPSAPESFMTAVQKLGFGNNTKLIMVFKKPFLAFRMLDTRGLFGHFWQRDCDDRVVITGFSGGRRADELAAMSEDDAVAYGVSELCTGLGEGIKNQMLFAHHGVWSTNPWIQGSYSHATPGMSDLRNSLQQPIAKHILYVGEATHTQGHAATVHGAIEEGLRAAEWVVLDTTVPTRDNL